MKQTYGVVAKLLGIGIDTVEGAFENDADSFDDIMGLTALVENYSKIAKTVEQYAKKVEKKEDDANAHAEWIGQMIMQGHIKEHDNRWADSRNKLAEMQTECDNYHSLYIAKEEELEKALEGLMVFLHTKGFDTDNMEAEVTGSKNKIHIQSNEAPIIQLDSGSDDYEEDSRSMVGETKAPKKDGDYLNDVNKIVAHLAEFIRASCKGHTFEVVDSPAYGSHTSIADLTKHIFYQIGGLSEGGKAEARTHLQMAWNAMVLENEFDSLYGWLADYDILDSTELADVIDNYLVEDTEDGLKIQYTPDYLRNSRDNRPRKRLKEGNNYRTGYYG